MNSLSSAVLIEQLKQIFAVHVIPITLISDKGPNYASVEFTDFTHDWDIQHVTSSPHHAKANGKVESAVKIMKSIISKANKQGTLVWKAILEWRNSPTPSQGSSPVQRLVTQNKIKESLYKPEVQAAVTAQVMCKRQLAKHYHDQSAKQLPCPVIGQSVRVNAHSQQPRSDWKPGVILIAPRSYLVEVNGRSYRRNRVHLRDAVQSQTDSLPVQEPGRAQTPGLPENKPANNDHDLASNQPLLSKSQQHPRRVIL